MPVTAAAIAAAADCEVFFPSSVALSKFPAAACGTHGCAGSLTADGKAYGVLRKTERIAFSHMVLFQWMHKTTASGIPWWTSWRDIISNIKA